MIENNGIPSILLLSMLIFFGCPVSAENGQLNRANTDVPKNYVVAGRNVLLRKNPPPAQSEKELRVIDYGMHVYLLETINGWQHITVKEPGESRKVRTDGWIESGNLKGQESFKKITRPWPIRMLVQWGEDEPIYIQLINPDGNCTSTLTSAEIEEIFQFFPKEKHPSLSPSNMGCSTVWLVEDTDIVMLSESQPYAKGGGLYRTFIWKDNDVCGLTILETGAVYSDGTMQTEMPRCVE